jgi:hypothetical protein
MVRGGQRVTVLGLEAAHNARQAAPAARIPAVTLFMRCFPVLDGSLPILVPAGDSHPGVGLS